MLRILIISTLLLGLSACSPLSSASGAAVTPQPTSENPATNTFTTSAFPTKAAGPIEPAMTLIPSPTPLSPALVGTETITSSPAPTMSDFTAVATGQWKVYTNPDWKLSINYPADWSVSTGSSMVVFAPPKGGAPIQLSKSGSSEPAGNEPLPNTRCTKFVNVNGVTISRCLDLVSLAYDAQFAIHSQVFSISAKQRVDLAVYNTMLDSIRSAQ